MNEKLFEFVTTGSPHAVSGTIQQVAAGVGSLSAIVVPWESNKTTLSIAIASTQGEGHALIHTNLGTVRLTDAGNELTRVEVLSEKFDEPEQQRLGRLFARFSSQVQSQLQAVTQ